MHMTSQKGAQLRWGSNETLPRASSPRHAARGANPASHTAGPGRPGPRTERLSANAHCQHNTCALRDTRLASLLWRCDPLWHQCIKVYWNLHKYILGLLIHCYMYVEARGILECVTGANIYSLTEVWDRSHTWVKSQSGQVKPMGNFSP